MSFVNIHGQPIAVDASAKKKPPPKKSSGSREAEHKGWLAVGYSPTQLADARREHEAAEAKSKEAPKPFNEDSFMRLHKPEKIHKKPYFSNEAALTACGLAEKSGWKNCHTRAVERAGK